MSKPSRRANTFRRRQCYGIKLAHPNILSAMAHAARISKVKHAPYVMYECGECGGTHVGRLGKQESILMYGPYSENVRELQGAL